jgi:hypothetical protein
LAVFRRGTQSASIRHMSFGPAGSEGFFLACAGDSETIHVFQGSRVTSSTSLGAVASMMPQMAKNFLEAQRAFSVVRLRSTGFDNALILSSEEVSALTSLTVVSSIGFAFIYELRPNECKLKREFSLRLSA